MAIVLRLDDLAGFAPSEAEDLSDDPMVLSDDPVILRRMWAMILLLALRDHATSVHYHPWLEDGGLSYVVAGARHAIVPPPAELAGPVIAVARSIFTEPARGGWLARLRGHAGAGAACASFELDLGFDVFPWDAIVWSSGARSGVELFRV